MTLEKALNRACDAIWASLSGTPIVITPDNTAAIVERVRIGMAAQQWDKPFDITVNLVDEGDFINVTAVSEGETATVGLRFEDAFGNVVIRVDTDGDNL